MIQPNPKKKIVKKKQQDDVNLFTPEETKQRRGSLGLPTSKAEEKKYYKKMEKEGAKNGKTMKKAKNGTSLGMKSVKAGFDNNPGVTRADIITAATKKAKSGAKLKKQAATAIAMKKAGKTPKAMMKSGGSMKKCKYGCK